MASDRKTLIARAAALGLLLVLTACIAPARADDDAAKPDDAAKRPLLRLDVGEWVDGEEGKDGVVQYLLRKKLKTAGFEVDSVRKTRWDKKKKPAPKKPAEGEGEGDGEGDDDGDGEGGDAEPDKGDGDGAGSQGGAGGAGGAGAGDGDEPPADEAKPKPALIVEGRVSAVYKPSTFYDEIIAHVYRYEAEVVVKDGDGNELFRISEKDRYGESKARADEKDPKRGTKKSALRTGLTRMATWLYVDLLGEEKLRAHLGAEDLAALEEELAKLGKVKQNSQDKSDQNDEGGGK